MSRAIWQQHTASYWGKVTFDTRSANRDKRNVSLSFFGKSAKYPGFHRCTCPSGTDGRPWGTVQLHTNLHALQLTEASLSWPLCPLYTPGRSHFRTEADHAWNPWNPREGLEQHTLGQGNTNLNMYTRAVGKKNHSKKKIQKTHEMNTMPLLWFLVCLSRRITDSVQVNFTGVCLCMFVSLCVTYFHWRGILKHIISLVEHPATTINPF